jgi:hypothetical protein
MVHLFKSTIVLIVLNVIFSLKIFSQTWVPATPFSFATLGFNSGIGGGVPTGITCSLVYNNELFVGGNFTSIGGIVAHSIARWNDNNWSNVGAANFLQNVFVSDMIVYNNKLYFTADKLYQWDGVSLQEFLYFDPLTQTNQPIIGSDLDVHNNDLYIVTNSSNFSGLYRFNSSTFTRIDRVNSMGSILCAESYNNSLYVGAENGLYKYDNSSWVNCNGIVTTNPLVYDLETFNNELMVLGSFNSIGGIALKNIAKYNGVNWSPISLPNGYYPNANFALGWYFTNHLNVIDDELYLAHTSVTMDIPVINPSPVMKYSGGQWNTISNNYTQGGRVNCVTNYNGNLYCGGDFDLFNDSPSFNNTPYQLGNFVKLDGLTVSQEELLSKNRLIIAPNPTSDKIFITLPQSINGAVFEIMDHFGKIVLKGILNTQENEIELETLSNGIYLIKIDGYEKIERIVKN